MKHNEEPALAEFISQGWSAFRKGWPDYLFVRPRDGGLEIMGLEVKREDDEVKPHQLAMHIALKAGGSPSKSDASKAIVRSRTSNRLTDDL